MSTRTQRQSSLLSLSEVKQIVDDIPLGRVDPKQVALLAERVFGWSQSDGGGGSTCNESNAKALGLGLFW